MISCTCHCGAVEVDFDSAPKAATDCNCSLCRRLGALWIYTSPDNVTVRGQTHNYSHGQKNLAVHRCAACGCVTHWSPLKGGAHMAVNLRMAAPEVAAKIPVRRFDGADTWQFLED